MNIQNRPKRLDWLQRNQLKESLGGSTVLAELMNKSLPTVRRWCLKPGTEKGGYRGAKEPSDYEMELLIDLWMKGPKK
jgi:hypothetical protein